MVNTHMGVVRLKSASYAYAVSHKKRRNLFSSALNSISVSITVPLGPSKRALMVECTLIKIQKMGPACHTKGQTSKNRDEFPNYPSGFNSTLTLYIMKIRKEKSFTAKEEDSFVARERREGRKMVEGGVPAIDIQDFPGQYQKLREACEVWGCFRIVNHKIPLELMSEMKAVVRSLLDLPSDIKKRNSDVIAGSGYMAPSEKNPLYEALGLYDMGSSQAVQAFCSQLDASPHQRCPSSYSTPPLWRKKLINSLSFYL